MGWVRGGHNGKNKTKFLSVQLGKTLALTRLRMYVLQLNSFFKVLQITLKAKNARILLCLEPLKKSTVVVLA